MNNDIPSDLRKYTRANAGYPASKSMRSTKVPEIREVPSADYETTQNYLNALGRTKVNIDSRVKKSVESMKQDTCFVQSHVDFCDELVERGYSLEEAIEKTDFIFDKLKDEETYKS